MDLLPMMISLFHLSNEGKQGPTLGRQPTIELALTLIPFLLDVVLLPNLFIYYEMGNEKNINRMELTNQDIYFFFSSQAE